MATILNQNKEKFNQENPADIPTYVFDGSYDEYIKQRKDKKVFLGVNVFFINGSKGSKLSPA